MNSKKFSEAMSEVNDRFYVEAANYQSKRRKTIWVKWGAIAACLVVMIYAGTQLYPQKPSDNAFSVPILTVSENTSEATSSESQEPSNSTNEATSSESQEASNSTNEAISSESQESSNSTNEATSSESQEPSNNALGLPMLTVSECISGGMGFEGYMAHDISDLVNANPWSEDSAIETLPVYKNAITFNDTMHNLDLDYDKMRERLFEVTDRLGLDKNTLTITDDVPDEATRKRIIDENHGGSVPDGYFQPTRFTVETENLKIFVEQDMSIVITFDPSISLPSEYNYMYHSSYEDIYDVAEYLQTEYKDLMGIDNPQIDIDGGGYNIDSEQSYSINFFDASGDIIEQIINYNFNSVHFGCDEEGKMVGMQINKPDLSNMVGNYPIITLEKASELLSNGNYITTVPCELPGMEYVKKTKLEYWTGKLEQYYIPYYVFYVELPEMKCDNGMKQYGAYYVPAISSEYISDMPTWDGSFN